MAYLGSKPSVYGAIEATNTTETLIATGGQTVFNCTQPYIPATLTVFLNGTRLLPTDYTATNGSTITLGVAASLNDELTVVSNASFVPYANANPSQEFFSGTGAQTVFTLNKSVAVSGQIIVFVGGIAQKPTDDYTASGTVLTFTTAPVTGTNNIAVYNVGYTEATINVPADGSVTAAKLGTGAEIGTDIQGYDLNTTKNNVANVFSITQIGTRTTNNTLSFALAPGTNLWKCTPTAGGALTFTNPTDGISGNIIFVNGSNYAITAHANTKVTASFLATISATGTYIINFTTDGTATHCSTGGASA